MLAGQQKAGRGRLGRRFESPAGKGVYCSLLLRPALSAADAQTATIAAAVSVARAVKALCGLELGIKWVNDLYYQGKKVCGILTEGAFNLETGKPEEVVVGIGFNVYPPAGGFPEDIRETADSIFHIQADEGKNRLAAAFLNRFFAIYQDPAHSDFAARYRDRSMVIGHPIRVITPTQVRHAYALDIDRDCRLVVRYEDGTVAQLSSAEVSIRTE